MVAVSLLNAKMDMGMLDGRVIRHLDFAEASSHPISYVRTIKVVRTRQSVGRSGAHSDQSITGISEHHRDGLRVARANRRPLAQPRDRPHSE